LIEKFNELEQVFASSNTGVIRLAASDLFDFLQFYAAWYFKQEEALMKQSHCPADAANKQAHAEFLGRFGKFYIQWQLTTMNLPLARQTYASLAAWINDHIMTIDVQMREYVKN
jgi:hemerythrin-like metal-binding protein